MRGGEQLGPTRENLRRAGALVCPLGGAGPARNIDVFHSSTCRPAILQRKENTVGSQAPRGLPRCRKSHNAGCCSGSACGFGDPAGGGGMLTTSVPGERNSISKAWSSGRQRSKQTRWVSWGPCPLELRTLLLGRWALMFTVTPQVLSAFQGQALCQALYKLYPTNP